MMFDEGKEERKGEKGEVGRSAFATLLAFALQGGAPPKGREEGGGEGIGNCCCKLLMKGCRVMGETGDDKKEGEKEKGGKREEGEGFDSVLNHRRNS